MSDVNAKVYKKQGGDELVIDNGGKITVVAGGKIGPCPAVADLVDNSGGAAANGTVEVIRNDSLANLATDTSAAVKELTTKLNAALAALRNAGIVT
jgi:hypothetical protein